MNRETWLAQALDHLAANGGRLRIDDLVASLGVTKGSFYWHFHDRDDFVHSVLDYWARQFTNIVAETIDKLPADAEQRLLALMEMVVMEQLARYDIAMRALASEEPMAAKFVRRVDKFRFDYVYELFSQLGFSKHEAAVRTEIFVGFHSLEPSMMTDRSRHEMRKIIRHRHAFFVKP